MTASLLAFAVVTQTYAALPPGVRRICDDSGTGRPPETRVHCSSGRHRRRHDPDVSRDPVWTSTARGTATSAVVAATLVFLPLGVGTVVTRGLGRVVSLVVAVPVAVEGLFAGYGTAMVKFAAVADGALPPAPPQRVHVARRIGRSLQLTSGCCLAGLTIPSNSGIVVLVSATLGPAFGRAAAEATMPGSAG